MDALLINPNFDLGKIRGKFKYFKEAIPPLNLAYIAAVLEKNNISVKIIDQFASNIDNNRVLTIIKKESPFLVGISCLTPSMPNIMALIKKIKIFNKNIKIVLGNSHASIFANELLKSNTADIVVHGEGEYATLEIAKALLDGQNFKKIKGISYKKGGRVYHNKRRNLIKDLNVLPYPAWHLLNIKEYSGAAMLSTSEIVFPIQASRGCPFKCVFCSQEYWAKKYRRRDIQNVVDEIEFFYDKFGVKNFCFLDSAFPMSKEQGTEFCREMTKRGLHTKVKWFIETRPDLVDAELLIEMKRAGLHLVQYGFESGNQKVLDNLRKGFTLQDSRKAMEYTKKAGILSFGLFMIGAPGETEETINQTINFAKELDCDFAKFNITVPFPGSKLFEDYKKEVDFKANEAEKFSSWNYMGCSLVNKNLNGNQLSRLQKRAMFNFYMRPKIILRHILKKSISFKNLLLGGYILFSSLLEK